MIGVFITMVFSIGMAGYGMKCLEGRGLNPLAAFGLGGLCALGLTGLLILFLGVVVELHVVVWLLLALSLGGLWFAFPFFKSLLRGDIERIQGWQWLPDLGIGIAKLFALIGCLAPSDTMDWDSIAYHLAVPKIWLNDGHIHPISFIHHSNFPLSIDNLYILGLGWGGQSGAKAFSLAIFIFGAFAIFGLAKTRYGTTAAWWAALAYATVPAVIWEGGTAYIDVGHGLFAGLGLWLLLSMEAGWLVAGLMLGLAVGTKYTGLQEFGLALVVSVPLLRFKLRSLFLATAVAAALGGAWYVKNVVWTGNPVYPFFYSKLGGKNWDDFSAKIYTEEQKTFGVPPSADAIAPAIIGLAYQPGRYTNPRPKLEADGSGASGFPMAATGGAILLCGLGWAFAGQRGRVERGALVWVLLNLLAWIVLSQQSRYALSFVPPLAIMGGALVSREKIFGYFLGGAIALQALISFYVIKTLRTDTQLPVVFGRVSADDYLKQGVAIYGPAQVINQLPKTSKIALYDEVFGFYLDVPYFWANPGHTTEIGYEQLSTGIQLADKLRSMGITHAYLNLAFMDPANAQRLVGAMTSKPYTEQEKASLSADLRSKWHYLIADAVQQGRFKLVQQFPKSLLFEVEP